MPNLRIVTKNALRQAASLTASSTAGNLAVSSLAAAVKSSLHRFTGTNGSYRATWAAPARIGCVALPFCNWSPTAKQRVRVSKEKSATNLQPQSETSGGWVAAGSTPPGVTPVPEINGVSAVRIDFLPGMSGGYAGCRAGRTQAGYSFPIKAGVSYANSLFVMLSRPLTGSESVQIYCTGTYGGAGVGINQLNSSAYVGLFSRVLLPASVMGLSGTNAFVIYLSGPVNSPLSVFLTRMQAEVDRHTSYYPSLETFTSRASVGTYIGSDGLIKTAPADTPRMQYDPMNPFAPPRLLLEAAATNYVVNSDSLGSGWVGAVSVAASTESYRGIPYRVLSKTTNAASQGLSTSVGSVAAGDTRTLTIALRAGSSDKVSFGIFDSSTGGTGWGVGKDSAATILEGPATRNGSNGGLFTFVGLSPTTDTLIQVTRTFVAAGTCTVYIYPDTSSSVVAGASVLACRVQLEAGGMPSSYIPTTTVAATRAADVYTSAPGVRPDGYIDHWQSYDYDSGWVLACPAPAVELEGFTAAQTASAYAYGGGAYARHWLPQQMDATGLAVDIADPDNLQGYIEAACMVAGPYLTTKYNASATSVSVIDRTELSRSAAGDQLAEPGTISRKVPVDLRAMPEADRAKFLELVRNSRAHPILMSVFPEHPDLALERDFMVYGRRTKDSDIAYQFAGAYSTTLEIEEI